MPTTVYLEVRDDEHAPIVRERLRALQLPDGEFREDGEDGTRFELQADDGKAALARAMTLARGVSEELRVGAGAILLSLGRMH